MIQEGKNELYQYLCCCLPWGVKVDLFGETKELVGLDISFPPTALVGYDINDCEPVPIEDIKPYLRPMESMTEEEKKEMGAAIQKDRISPYGEIKSSGCDSLLLCTIRQAHNLIDWLLKNHFDFMGLIPKGLAVEAPEGMYKTE